MLLLREIAFYFPFPVSCKRIVQQHVASGQSRTRIEDVPSRVSRASVLLTASSHQGNGIFLYADGGKYTGDWNQVWPPECCVRKRLFEFTMCTSIPRRVGTWVTIAHYIMQQDRREGTGTMVHANGDKYTGSWRSDMRHGSGNCQVCTTWWFCTLRT